MNFEPEKFFIGLVDFFSILMPGALLVYLGKDWVAARLGVNGFALDDPEAVAVFLFLSYLLGHFAFLIGATLDDFLYDPMRKHTELGQIGRLADGKPLSPPDLRRLATSRWFFGKHGDKAVTQAVRLKARALQPLDAEDAVNAFQWSKAWLSKNHPAGLVQVQRFEADSKFFRSFVVALAVLAIFYAARRRAPEAWLCLAAIVPALWRYMDQRYKATQQAYWLVITLAGPDAATKERPPRPDGLTHAGGVVFRTSGGIRQFLLVEARQNRQAWVLPKGHIEPGEEPRHTAVREVREETGHWARVVRPLEDARFGPQPHATVTRFYLMQLEEPGKDGPAEDRGQAWLSMPEAINKASFPETKALLQNAATIP